RRRVECDARVRRGIVGARRVERRAHDLGYAHEDPDARRRRDRRRRAGKGALERTRPRGRFLCRAEGGRVMADLTDLTLTKARDALKSKAFSASELTDAHLSAIEAARPLNAFILETPDRARAMARASDERLAKGEGGPLEGIPLGIKDMFCT